MKAQRRAEILIDFVPYRWRCQRFKTVIGLCRAVDAVIDNTAITFGPDRMLVRCRDGRWVSFRVRRGDRMHQIADDPVDVVDQAAIDARHPAGVRGGGAAAAGQAPGRPVPLGRGSGRGTGADRPQRRGDQGVRPGRLPSTGCLA